MATATRRAGVPRFPAFTEKEVKALKSIHAAERAGRPTRVSSSILAVLCARGAIYTVEFHSPRRTFAHLKARGAVMIDVDPGNRS